jgi:hypothetical protein
VHDVTGCLPNHAYKDDKDDLYPWLKVIKIGVHTISEVLENLQGLDINSLNEVRVYVNDIHSRDTINAKKNNTEISLQTSEDNGNKYDVMENQIHNVSTHNKSLHS